MPTLAGIAVHPIKALDPLDCTEGRISSAGGLERDRRYAIVDEDGDYVNGKRTSRVHQIRSDFDPDVETVRLQSPEYGSEEFHLSADRSAIESWLSEYFGFGVTLEQKVGGMLTDGAVYGESDDTGPTVISRSTLEEVASWFDGIDAEEMRMRLRPNLVVEGVPAFWEDGLTADENTGLQIGDTTLIPTEPIPRCVVPSRNPKTGESYADFRRIFIEQREETFPEWAPSKSFDHFFQLMVGTRIPESEIGSTLSTGESAEILEI